MNSWSCMMSNYMSIMVSYSMSNSMVGNFNSMSNMTNMVSCMGDMTDMVGVVWFWVNIMGSGWSKGAAETILISIVVIVDDMTIWSYIAV